MNKNKEKIKPSTDHISSQSNVGCIVGVRTLGLKYAIEQRLRFIDFLFHQYGEVNRSAVVDYFGISVPQVTKDFKMYMNIAPDNIRYCNSDKAYRKNPEFKRVWA